LGGRLGKTKTREEGNLVGRGELTEAEGNYSRISDKL